jgi:hypothetical protein
MVRTDILHLFLRGILRFHTASRPGREELATRLSGDYRDRTFTG